MLLFNQIGAQLDRLAAWEPGPFPVVSLYLNVQRNQTGRPQIDAFLKKELGERLRTFEAGTPQRMSLEKDVEHIQAHLRRLSASANGLALFACSGSDLFEAIEVAAPFAEHRLYVSSQPHLYPLARLIDECPRYAVVLTDTNAARIFVIAVNTVERRELVEGTRTKRHKMGGWSQARYQRHTENFHLHHVKEVADALTRVVRDEEIASVIIAGDEVVVPMVKAELPKDIAERVVDIIKLDIHANEHRVLDVTIASMREHDRLTDRERVEALLDEYRGSGLAVVGIEATRRALERGQVHELVIAAAPETIASSATSAEGSRRQADEERVADELIAGARQTSAAVRFIEDPSVARLFGGVGAHLRFKT